MPLREEDLSSDMKVLIDTATWINHFFHKDESVQMLLTRKRVVGHPYVIGELILGSNRSLDFAIEEMRKLPQIPVATSKEVFTLIEEQKLSGKGIGLVDVYLLAGCLIDGSTQLLTDDKRLAKVASELGIGFFGNGID